MIRYKLNVLNEVLTLRRSTLKKKIGVIDTFQCNFKRWKSVLKNDKSG